MRSSLIVNTIDHWFIKFVIKDFSVFIFKNDSVCRFYILNRSSEARTDVDFMKHGWNRSDDRVFSYFLGSEYNKARTTNYQFPVFLGNHIVESFGTFDGERNAIHNAHHAEASWELNEEEVVVRGMEIEVSGIKSLLIDVFRDKVLFVNVWASSN